MNPNLSLSYPATEILEISTTVFNLPCHRNSLQQRLSNLVHNGKFSQLSLCCHVLKLSLDLHSARKTIEKLNIRVYLSYPDTEIWEISLTVLKLPRHRNSLQQRLSICCWHWDISRTIYLLLFPKTAFNLIVIWIQNCLYLTLLQGFWQRDFHNCH